MNRGKTISGKSSLFADAMLLFAVLGWGFSFPIAKLAMNDWRSYKFLFLSGRFWMAFLIFALIATKKSSLKQVVAHAKPGFWTGLTLIIAFGFQYKALGLGSAAEVAFITALSSVLVPVGVWAVLKKPVAAGTWLGLVVATIGAIVIEWSGSFAFDHAGVFALVGAVGVAAYLILINYFMAQKNDDQTKKYEKIPFLTVQLLVLAVSATLLTGTTEISFTGLPAWSNKAFFGMIFMSIVATAGAFFIQTTYQPLTKPERAALVFTLEAPLAGLFSYLMLGEPFGLRMLLGAGLVVVGVAVAEVLEARRSGDKPSPPPRSTLAGGSSQRRPVLPANAVQALSPSSPASVEAHGGCA